MVKALHFQPGCDGFEPWPGFDVMPCQRSKQQYNSLDFMLGYFLYQGSGLVLSDAVTSIYKVLIGLSSCGDVAVHQDVLTCKPPKRKPDLPPEKVDLEILVSCSMYDKGRILQAVSSVRIVIC